MKKRGEFFNIAERLALVATERDGISPKEIRELFTNIEIFSGMDIFTKHKMKGLKGHGANCYPGEKESRCYPLALFISLQGRLKKGQGHLKFGDVFKKIINHVQGECPEITKHIVIITDSWSASVYDEWHSNIKQMYLSGVKVEAYLIGHGGWVNELNIFSESDGVIQVG